MTIWSVIYREYDESDELQSITIEASSAKRAHDLFYEYDYPGVVVFVEDDAGVSDEYFDPFEIERN